MNVKPRQVTPVILAGGSGTRLWPLSRKSYPKQFVPLLGDDTLFRAAARRLSGKTGRLEFGRPDLGLLLPRLPLRAGWERAPRPGDDRPESNSGVLKGTETKRTEGPRTAFCFGARQECAEGKLP